MPPPPLRLRDEPWATLGVPVRTEGGRIPFWTGAWNAQGEAIAEAGFERGAHAQPLLPERQQARASRSGAFILGGLIHGQYGHFLFETLARAWAWLPSDRPILWLIKGHRHGFLAFQSQILDILGVDPARHVFVGEPTRFERLLIPEAGAVLWRSFHPAQARALGVVPFAPAVPGKRVWLSRSKAGENKARVLNEAELEALLRADGWVILHPEELDIRGQLAVMRDAETLAGFDGSAFHSLVLGGGVSARQILIPRGGAGRVSPTFQAISDGKNLEQILLRLEMETVSGDRRSSRLVRLVSVEASFAALRQVVRQPVRRPGGGQPGRDKSG